MTQTASPALPPDCDVLVIGAGPSGSAVAHWLARHGLDVRLVDQHVFPREKICGDGLIPDAHAALQRLGLLDAVLALAHPVRHVRCVGPSGAYVDVPGTLAVLPRRQLDLLLVQGARGAGAQLHTPVRLDELIEAAGQVVGARLRDLGDGTVHEVRARWVVIATGAQIQTMQQAGLCDRRAPSGVALRGYVQNAAMRDRITTMEVVWHKALRPGYGWIFPTGNDVYNIGVGAFFDRKGGQAGPDANLRQVFDAFTRCHAPARELMAGGTLVGELKGAPLRCTLEGARYGRPGLIAVGEAIGSTYDFTGEGIGKALETGLLAAEAILAGWSAQAPEAQVRADYARRLEQLKPRFDLYQKANRINRHPWLVDLVIARAGKNARLRERMSGVLNETSNPGHLLSLHGLIKLFVK